MGGREDEGRRKERGLGKRRGAKEGDTRREAGRDGKRWKRVKKGGREGGGHQGRCQVLETRNHLVDVDVNVHTGSYTPMLVSC